MITRRAIFASASALAMTTIPSVPAQAQSTPMLGQLMVWGGNFCPRGWASAEGQLLPISQNTALFSLLGTTFGGDGRTTFALPDMRGRMTVGSGQGPGLSNYSLGGQGGVETVTLSQLQMPSHTHTTVGEAYLPTSSQGPDTNSPNGSSLATFPPGTNVYQTGPADQTGMIISGTVQINPTGGSNAHTNQMPYLVNTWCIALQGIYPSRS